MRKKLRSERALILALFPIPYLAVTWLLSAVTDAMQKYLNWDGLLWQCVGALALTMFVLGPLCFIGSSIACIYYAWGKLRSRESVRKHIILIIAALATIGLSIVWFKWFWPVPA